MTLLTNFLLRIARLPPSSLMWLLSGAKLCHSHAAAIQPSFAPLGAAASTQVLLLSRDSDGAKCTCETGINLHSWNWNHGTI